MVFIGLAVNNTLAALEVLVGKRSPFERTPKYNLTAGASAGGRSRYRSRASRTVLVELLLSACCAVAGVLALVLKQYAALPFLMMWSGGYAMVSYYSLRHDHLESPKILVLESPASSPAVAQMSGQSSAA
jgi:hypothetical protein